MRPGAAIERPVPEQRTEPAMSPAEAPQEFAGISEATSAGGI